MSTMGMNQSNNGTNYGNSWSVSRKASSANSVVGPGASVFGVDAVTGVMANWTSIMVRGAEPSLEVSWAGRPMHIWLALESEPTVRWLLNDPLTAMLVEYTNGDSQQDFDFGRHLVDKMPLHPVQTHESIESNVLWVFNSESIEFVASSLAIAIESFQPRKKPAPEPLEPPPLDLGIPDGW